ncbi:uncharacterized protein MELLADRAFT_112243 [Melampsora larici-populina 98AG31]|uniref:Uncharacterized protein n=1 Tax=Melampsora larici-populina (strain 98AG31 / pathotype 3-4-7) TaxID=747676 RepID=F4S5U6_MELLP|nr:uncharacterized protein MELLADRAFT_112243 [Melampsora larici-populina 98AG31]EGF99959.1 hypothetical protein MELLADRAFT_112243 [Melampsora larici-populina 98AG31]
MLFSTAVGPGLSGKVHSKRSIWTLHSLALHTGEDWNADPISQALWSGELSFELPNLKFFTSSHCLPVGFLRAFQASKNISKIHLCETPMLHELDVTTWLQSEIWPKLTKFIIWHSTAFESSASVHGLLQLATGYGIKMRLNGHLNELYDGSKNPNKDKDCGEKHDKKHDGTKS